jgi:hypothetical protein
MYVLDRRWTPTGFAVCPVFMFRGSGLYFFRPRFSAILLASGITAKTNPAPRNFSSLTRFDIHRNGASSAFGKLCHFCGANRATQAE